MRIGVWMAERVITPFIPPNTVNTAVTAISPIALFEENTTGECSHTDLSKHVSYQSNDGKP